MADIDLPTEICLLSRLVYVTIIAAIVPWRAIPADVKLAILRIESAAPAG
jgi:hypothetical protein